jgi:integrase
VQETISISYPKTNGAEGFVFGTTVTGLDAVMRSICKKLGCERATPHDLRRTFGSKITALGYGRQAMDRLLNHSDRSIASVYDRHSYAKEDQRIMESVSRHIVAIVEGTEGDSVIRGRF